MNNCTPHPHCESHSFIHSSCHHLPWMQSTTAAEPTYMAAEVPLGADCWSYVCNVVNSPSACESHLSQCCAAAQA
jgi:hypothetical protein